MSTHNLESQTVERVSDSAPRDARRRDARLLVSVSCALAVVAMAGLPKSASAQKLGGSSLSSVVGFSVAGANIAETSSRSKVSRSRSTTRVGHRSIRGRRSPHHGYRSSYRHRSSYYFGLASPWAWYGGGYYPYAYRSYGYGPYGPGYGNGRGYYRANAGALDLDIKPEEAQIYVDGELVGIADNYDGFPRYLWLEEGTHNVVIYHEGLKTLGKQIKLEAGVVIRLKDQMVSGEAKSPADMYAKLGPVPGANKVEDSGEVRLAPWRYADRDQDKGRDQEGVSRSDGVSQSDASGSDRTRSVRQEPVPRSARSEESWRQRGGGSRVTGAAQRDFRAAAGEVRFKVEPADAVIYLDGRLVGSAGELDQQEQPLLIDPGSHVVEITRPGYSSARQEFSVSSGASETIQVRLKKNG